MTTINIKIVTSVKQGQFAQLLLAFWKAAYCLFAPDLKLNYKYHLHGAPDKSDYDYIELKITTKD